MLEGWRRADLGGATDVVSAGEVGMTTGGQEEDVEGGEKVRFRIGNLQGGNVGMEWHWGHRVGTVGSFGRAGR